MAALVKYADSDSTKDPASDEEKTGKGKKNGNGKGPQHNPASQGGNKRKADDGMEFVANTNTQGNNHRRKGRQPPRSGGSGPTLEQLLNEPCPRHGSREKPTTHLWKDCAIMKAFKNSNMFNGNNGQGGGFHGPGGGSNSNFQNSQGNQGGFNQQSGQGNQQQQGDTRPIQRSSTVDSIMCLLPVCASETRSFIRGL